MDIHPGKSLAWVPLHCPRSKCPYHNHLQGPWPYRKRGFYVESHREKRPGTTPAMLRGLAGSPWRLEEIRSVRSFPARVGLPPRWWQYYRREVRTSELSVNRRHELVYAF